jgi:hypothetical protein
LSPIPPATALIDDPTTWPAPPPHFWISVGYQTGLVTVSELAANMQDYQPATPKQMAGVVTDALITDVPAVNQTLGGRYFARFSQSAGGR